MCFVWNAINSNIKLHNINWNWTLRKVAQKYL